MTPEQQRALALARARKRKAEAEGIPPASMATTTPDFQNGGMDLVSEGGPQTLGQMKIPGLQDYIVQNMQEQRDAEAQRKQLDQTATQAGFEARGQAAERMGVNSPLMQAAAAPALNLAQQEGGRQVFNEAGVMLPDEAAGTAILNAQAVGIPGFVSGDMRERMKQAYEDQPGWALTGEIAASVGPGEALFQGGKMAYNALAKPFVTKVLPKGGSAVARGTRFAAHGAEQTGAWAGQNAFYQATTGASSRAAQEGRAPTLTDVKEGAQAGATDPLNLAGPAALIGLNRMASFVRSGGTSITPADRAAEVEIMTRGGSRPATERAGQVLGMDVLGTELRPQSVQRVVNLLSADMAPEDISGLFESVQQRLSSLPEAEASRLTLGQALLDALENPETSQAARQFPQAAFNLRQSLRNASLGGELGNPRRGDRRAGIVGGVREELQGSQTDYVKGKIDSALGDKRLISIDDQVAEAKKQIGGQYNEVLAQADPSRPEARGLAMIVQGEPTAPALLRRRAANAGYLKADGTGDVEAYIQARPDEAAHWTRSGLAKAARSASGREKLDLETTVDQLDALLDTNPGYADARRQYGTEMGLDDAVSFGDRFVATAKNEYATDKLIRELEGMSEQERSIALLSVRNNLKSYLNASQADGAARITSLTNEGVLGALQQLGPEGQQLAEDLKFMRREQKYLGNTVYGSDTARNLKASDAEKLGSMKNGKRGLGPEIVGDAVATGVSGHFAPILTSARIAGNALKNIGAPRVSTLNDEARFLMARRNNVPKLPQPGSANFSPPPRNAFANNQSGFVRPDAASTMMTGAGATAGALNPLDLNNDGKKDWQDRAMTAALYGSGGLAARGITGAYKRGLDASVRRSVHPPASPRPRAANDMTLPRSASTAPSRPVRKVALEPMDLEEARALSFVLSGEKDLAVVARDLGIDVAPGKLAKNDYLGERLRNMVERERKEALKVANESIREARGWNQKPPEKPSADVVPFKPKSSGTATFGNDLANAAVGGTVGGMGGSFSGEFIDYNKDGKIDETDKQIGFLIGTGVGAFGAPAGTRIGVKGQRFDMKGSGPSGNLPKLMKDVPVGKPKPGQRPDISGTIKRGQEGGSNLPAARTTGDPKTIEKAAIGDAQNMLRSGTDPAKVWEKTGYVMIPIKNRPIIYAPGAESYQNVVDTFFMYRSKPDLAPPDWYVRVLQAAGEDPAPLQLGGQRAPMVQKGKPQNAFARPK